MSDNLPKVIKSDIFRDINGLMVVLYDNGEEFFDSVIRKFYHTVSELDDIRRITFDSKNCYMDITYISSTDHWEEAEVSIPLYEIFNFYHTILEERFKRG